MGMRRMLLLALTIAVSALAVPTASQAYLTGVADQSWTVFTNGYYTRLIQRQTPTQRISRYIAPYDAADGSRANIAYLNYFTAWYNAAIKDHVRMLVALYHSEQPKKVTHMPSVALYTADIQRLMKRFPAVEAWQPWNEANRGYIPRVLASPSPLQSAEYYKAMRKVCPKVSTHCTIVALDVLDQNNVGPSLAYIASFRADLGRDAAVGQDGARPGADAEAVGPAQLLGHEPLLERPHERGAQRRSRRRLADRDRRDRQLRRLVPEPQRLG